MRSRKDLVVPVACKPCDFTVISFVIFIVLPTLCTTQGPVANFPVGDCNVSKQCVGSPEPTCVTQGLCLELVKWTYNPTFPDKVKFDLYGVPPIAGSTNFWIALGLNHVTGSMVKVQKFLLYMININNLCYFYANVFLTGFLRRGR